jgi:hypothetical protein
MNEQIQQLMDKISVLEADLEAEIARNHAELRLGIEKGRILFEEEVLRRHRELKTSLTKYILNARPLVVLTAPVIYSLIFPLVLLDLCVSIYHAICFPAYGLAKVRRRDYLAFDREHLAYLNGLEKLNCAYCSYANGLIAFVREVAGRTERHWCPIKHAKRAIGAHPYYGQFADFGDAARYRKIVADLNARAASPEKAAKGG